MTEKFGHSHISCSGATPEVYAVLTTRYIEDHAKGPDNIDHWLYIQSSKVMQVGSVRMKGVFGNMWMSDQGWAYLARSSADTVERFKDLTSLTPADTVEEFVQPFVPLGVWGLDNEHVYTWGTKKRGPDDYVHQVSMFDGKDWGLLPEVPFQVISLHGCSPACLYAVGHRGIVRYDGDAWHAVPAPTQESLLNVFVASEDEVYIAGDGGSIMAGSSSGFRVIASLPGDLPVTCVAKFKGRLYIGGGPLGLYRRVGNSDELEQVRKWPVSSFDARAEWLFVAGDLLAGYTGDGDNFRGAGADFSDKDRGFHPADL